MIWTAFSGSWRHPEVTAADVEQGVLEELGNGYGIVTGGALGVDYQAAVTALGADSKRLKIILPTSQEVFELHHLRRAEQGVITAQMAADLSLLLNWARGEGCIEEHPERTLVGWRSYYARNQDMVDASDALRAYRVNSSRGTGDTIERARRKGIPVTVKEYVA